MSTKVLQLPVEQISERCLGLFVCLFVCLFTCCFWGRGSCFFVVFLFLVLFLFLGVCFCFVCYGFLLFVNKTDINSVSPNPVNNPGPHSFFVWGWEDVILCFYCKPSLLLRIAIPFSQTFWCELHNNTTANKSVSIYWQ